MVPVSDRPYFVAFLIYFYFRSHVTQFRKLEKACISRFPLYAIFRSTFHKRGSEWGSWDQGHMAKMVLGPGTFGQNGPKTARSRAWDQGPYDSMWMGPGTK